MMYKKMISKEDMVFAVVIAIPLWKPAEAVREKRPRVHSVYTRNDAAGPFVDKGTTEKRVTKVGDDIRAVSDFFGFQPAQFCKLKMADLPVRDIMCATDSDGDEADTNTLTLPPSDLDEPKLKRVRCNDSTSSTSGAERKSVKKRSRRIPSFYVCPTASAAPEQVEGTDASSAPADNSKTYASTLKIKERISKNMYALVEAYSDIQEKDEDSEKSELKSVCEYESRLCDFGKVVEETTKYGDTEHLASLKYDISSAAYQSTVSSLEFSPADNTLFSVADISRTIQVKIWNLNMSNSVMTIRPYFVVCTVNFGFSKHEIAVGSADRSVYQYDLRQPLRPVKVFSGHRQAVSYVRYLNRDEIVSASTDNNLRLWNVRSGECTRVFGGHRNTKNFVGLSSSEDHILTGSEDNRAYVYYKVAARPVLCYDVDSSRCVTTNNEFYPTGFENESEVFVSAVAWRPESSEILVGNSIGRVDVLKVC
ncbi:unnamed protein product [Nippostrongylus brasiliensis]|uniref:E3 ubiquitin-protein ligase RFWD2 (inferred by orthology to a human protein) n=1 Tax=Nippostrongylus brasiliensis TaxID=27835 RepID=A0A0N4XT80_NIPBR|nr:unnamed protein product [Nippostrongylus brasiliensis]